MRDGKRRIPTKRSVKIQPRPRTEMGTVSQNTSARSKLVAYIFALIVICLLANGVACALGWGDGKAFSNGLELYFTQLAEL